MRKKIVFLLFLSALLNILSACKEEIDPVAIEFSDISFTGTQEFSTAVSSSITKTGSNEVSEHGFAFSKTIENPEIDDKSIKKGAIDRATPTPINFSGSISGLEAGSEYFVRAFAVTGSATFYGKSTKFKTSDIRQPGVSTGNASDITINSAKLSGSLAAAGTYPITERGVVWATTASPTTANSKAAISGNVSTFPDNFSVNASGLTLNTTYNYRAYVISNGVTSYGENKTFKTQDMIAPGIRTEGSPKAGDKTATAWGTVTTKGTHPISEYGICWNTAANPTTSNTKKAITGDVSAFPRQFEVVMENLNPATTYHFRAYVIMNGVTTYGENVSFTTSVNEPSVSTQDVFSIVGRGTVMTGRVAAQGSFPITEIGIVYGATSTPTTANTKLSKTGTGVTFPHNYEFTVAGGLGGSGAIYFRAYVISNGNTYYGEPKLARAVPPGLQTGTSSLSGSTYTLRGTITSHATLKVTEYGIVWSSVNQTPTVTNSNKLPTSVPATSTFFVPLNFNKTLPFASIGSCKGVFFRAYAITSDGAVHYAGNIAQFATDGCVN